jgi:hypothetical protein
VNRTWPGVSAALSASAVDVAQLDPVVAPSVPPADPGYLSIPGPRTAAFFHLPDADPAVVAHEEATRAMHSFT